LTPHCNRCNVNYRLAKKEHENNQRRILAYEKLDHFCFGVLCSVDHDGFLRERTSDDNYHAASDHRDYSIIGQNHAQKHAAGGARLPGQQHRERGLGRVTGVWISINAAMILARSDFVNVLVCHQTVIKL
jgi:hypothetical protein